MTTDVTYLYAKVNTGAYGTDPVPAAATDAFVVFDYMPTAFEADEGTRDVEKGYAGANDVFYSAERQLHAFSTELCGSGTADVATKWGSVLLRGCMVGAPVITAGTKVGYPLETADDGADLGVYGWKSNARHRSKGARGNAKFSYTLNQIPKIGWDYMALPVGAPMDAAAAGTPTFTAQPRPLPVNMANTACSIGGFAVGLRSAEIDLGMKTEFFSTTAIEAIVFGKDASGDRRSVSASFVFELPDPSVKNYFDDVRNRTALAFSLTHGTVAGNIVKLSSTKLKLGKPSYQKEGNRLFMSAPARFIPDAAGNELIIETQ